MLYFNPFVVIVAGDPIGSTPQIGPTNKMKMVIQKMVAFCKKYYLPSPADNALDACPIFI